MALLADLAFETRTVIVGKSTVEVRPLSVRDIASLAARHDEALATLFEGNTVGDGSDRTLSRLLHAAPLFVSDLIAAAVGEADGAEAAADLPFGVQLTLLRTAWELMEIPEEEVSNFLEGLAGMIHRLAEDRAVEEAAAETGSDTLPSASSS